MVRREANERRRCRCAAAALLGWLARGRCVALACCALRCKVECEWMERPHSSDECAPASLPLPLALTRALCLLLSFCLFAALRPASRPAPSPSSSYSVGCSGDGGTRSSSSNSSHRTHHRSSSRASSRRDPTCIRLRRVTCNRQRQWHTRSTIRSILRSIRSSTQPKRRST